MIAFSRPRKLSGVSMRLSFLALACLLTAPAFGQGIAAQRLNTATNFNRPILVTQPQGETARLWVVEQGGVIRIMNAATGAVNATPFLTLTGLSSGGETGLLGVAFHPDYATNGYFFLYYNRTVAPAGRAIYRFRVDPTNPNIADPASATPIWVHPTGPSIHNGGWIAFGPDRNLFIAWGESGTAANAQDITDNPLGKILRIDIDGPDNIIANADDDQFPDDAVKNYTIPLDNPYVGLAGDDEIWAHGLRNPFRNSFDKLTGELYIADVGAGTWEEVSVAPAPPAAPGRNYGWNCMEGFFCTGSQSNTSCACNTGLFTPPAYAYLSGGGASECAISGGYVYRGCAMPWLHGTYLFGDYCSSKVWTSTYNGTLLTGVTDISPQLWTSPRPAIYSFGQDSSGELYICAGTGVYKLVPTGVANQCGCGSADYNGDGDFGTDLDIEIFFRCLGGDCPLICDIWCSDFNGDGDFGTDADIEAFFRVLAGGFC